MENRIEEMVNNAVDRMKTSANAVPVIIVGGSGILIQRPVVSERVRDRQSRPILPVPTPSVPPSPSTAATDPRMLLAGVDEPRPDAGAAKRKPSTNGGGRCNLDGVQIVGVESSAGIPAQKQRHTHRSQSCR